MRHTFVCSLFVCLASLMLVSTAQSQYQPQDVWTWHYDNNRTGWQQHETKLKSTNVNTTSFQQLSAYNVAGEVYAQPLALDSVDNMSPNCQHTGPCSVVFIATEEDMLYAFDADYPYEKLWGPVDLAGNSSAGGTYVNCSNSTYPCWVSVLDTHIGVTGTPVIDRAAGILYVVSLVNLNFFPDDVRYYVHAIDFRTGQEFNHSTPFPISANVSGYSLDLLHICRTATSSSTINFNAWEHLQRAGLLLLNGDVYVAFNPGENETANGWIFDVHFDGSQFQQKNVLATTPYGTGGGIWMDGAGLASDGTYIFASTGNGTYDLNQSNIPFNVDMGGSLIKLNPDLTLAANGADKGFFTPADNFSYGGNGRCANDEDFGSGGIVLLPTPFIQNHPRVLVTADKETKLYVLDRDTLPGFTPPADQILQEITTPSPKTSEGYWGTPAYWEWTDSLDQTTRYIYTSPDATSDLRSNAPDPVEGYQLGPQVNPGPIPATPVSHGPGFCGHGGAPSVSSDASAQNSDSGIVWAYEDYDRNSRDQRNPNCTGSILTAVLHAYRASDMMELFPDENNLPTTNIYGSPSVFSTPVVFNGKVYMGTRGTTDGNGVTTGIVDIFGCPSCQ